MATREEMKASLMATQERAVNLIQQNRIEKREDLAVFGVDGFSGNSYFVVVLDGQYPTACTCPAGQFGMSKCYHRDGVEAYLQMMAVEPVEDEESYGF